jgi:hypothetical protein
MYKFNSKFFILSVLLSLVGVTAWTQNQPITIYAIHGLKGDKTTWCQAEKEIESAFKSRFVPIEYNTNSSTLKVDDFAKEVAEKISADQKKSNTQGAPFVILTHSQGGLVALKMILDCQKTKNCQGRPLALINMGTPYWGSSIAMPAAKVATYLSDVLNVKATLPKNQIKNLEAGGLNFTNLRKTLISLKALPEGLKIFEVSGWIKEAKGNLKFTEISRVFRGFERDTDLAVEVPNGTMDFNYFIETEENRLPVKQGSVKSTEKRFFVPLPHTSLGDQLGLACIKEQSESWPVVKEILIQAGLESGSKNEPEVNRRDVSLSNKIENSIQDYSVEIKIYLPMGYQRKLDLSENNIRASEVRNSESEKLKSFHSQDAFLGAMESSLERRASDRDATLFVPNSPLNMFHGMNQAGEAQASVKFHSFFHLGAFQPGYDSAEIEYTIDGLKGWKTKKFTLNVSRGKSSYAEIYLSPELPLEASRAESWKSANQYELARVTVGRGKLKTFNLVRSESLKSWMVHVDETDSSSPTICYRASTGRILGQNRNEVKSEFGGNKNLATLPEREEVTVLARLALNGQDRYFVAFRKNDSGTFQSEIQFGWMERQDLDLDSESAKACNLNP